MNFKHLLLPMLAAALVSACSKNKDNNVMDELDPSQTTEDELRKMDEEYESATGKSAHIRAWKGTCRYKQCPVWALVDKSEQTLTLYIDGKVSEVWDVSSGGPGYSTPNFNQNPNGRIYDAYTSKAFPGGDYQGLGNMPYVVFIEGGYGIHGTTKGNWSRLGNPASHGCIRVHPDNGLKFNRLVRKHGVGNVWITVIDSVPEGMR